MQDMMKMLNEQSKVIGCLQETIEGLNITIKGLNDKIERMEASNGHPKLVHENDESPKCLEKPYHISDVNEKVVRLTVHENVSVKPSNVSSENVKHTKYSGVSEKVQVQTKKQNSIEHKNTVHEKVKIPKYQDASEKVQVEAQMQNSIEHKNTVHEKCLIKSNGNSNEETVLVNVGLENVHENVKFSKCSEKAQILVQLQNENEHKNAVHEKVKIPD